MNFVYFNLDTNPEYENQPPYNIDADSEIIFHNDGINPESMNICKYLLQVLLNTVNWGEVGLKGEVGQHDVIFYFHLSCRLGVTFATPNFMKW